VGNDRGAAKTTTMLVWLVIVAIVGVFGLDAYSVLSNRVHTEDNAQAAALAASQAYQTNNDNLPDAYAAAVASVAGKNDTVLTAGFTVDPNGQIHLVVTHTVQTMVLSRIPPLRHFTVVTEHGDATFTAEG
jgi:type II secretory pathway pseudopilin PulG